MNRPVVRPLFTREQVRNLYREALDLVDELDTPEDLRVHVLAGVASMLGQMYTDQQQAPLMQAPASLADRLR